MDEWIPISYITASIFGCRTFILKRIQRTTQFVRAALLYRGLPLLFVESNANLVQKNNVNYACLNDIRKI